MLNRAEKHFKENPDLKEERILFYENWKAIERGFEDHAEVEKIEKKMPRRVKKQRRVPVVAVQGVTVAEAATSDMFDEQAGIIRF